MNILQGVLAFSVVMIVFATVVSAIVEIIVRALRIRPALLMEAVGLYVEGFLRSELKRRGIKLPEDASDWKQFKAHVVGALVGNPARRKLPELTKSGDGSYSTDSKVWRTNAVENLSTYAFLQRLAKTEVGKRIIAEYNTGTAEAHAQLQSLLLDLVRTYERFTATINERIRVRGQRYSVIIAVAVALVFNVSAGRLFTELTENTALQLELIAQAETLAEANREQIAQEQAAVSSQEQDQSLEDVADRIADLQARSDALLESASLPIGPDQFPYNLTCNQWTDIVQGVSLAATAVGYFCDGAAASLQAAASQAEAASTSSSASEPRSFADLTMWFLNVILAGLLIGLGGPFWYRVFSSLSHVAQLVRMIRGGGHTEVMSQDAADQPATKFAFKEAISKENGGSSDGDLATVFMTAAGKTPPRVVNGILYKPGEKIPTDNDKPVNLVINASPSGASSQ